MRVLVTGGRDFLDILWMYAGLDLLHQTLPGGITEIIEGGAGGADLRGRWWAERNDIKVTEVKADWERYNPVPMGQKNPAGMIRNREMLELKPDIVFATPGGRGTANMVAISQRAGIRVVYLEKMPVMRSEGPLVVSRIGL